MAKAGELDWSELYKTGTVEQDPVSKMYSKPVKKDYHKTDKKPSEEELNKEVQFIMKGWQDSSEGQWKNEDHYDTVIEGAYSELDERNWQDPNTVFEQMKEAKVTSDTAAEWTGREPLTKGMSEKELVKWRMFTSE